jgi:hypothetical protein
MFKKKQRSREGVFQKKLQDSEEKHRKERKEKERAFEEQLERKEQALKLQLEARELELAQVFEVKESELKQELEAKVQTLAQQLAAKEAEFKEKLDVSEPTHKQQLEAKEAEFIQELDVSEQTHKQQLEASQETLRQQLKTMEDKNLHDEEKKSQQQGDGAQGSVDALEVQERVEPDHKEPANAPEMSASCKECASQSAALATTKRELDRVKTKLGRWHHLWFMAVFRIRIHLILIRIQHFRLNTSSSFI